MLGTFAMTALIVLAYPTVRDNASLDSTFAGLPAGVQASLGLGDGLTLTSPAGYLNSQFLANVLPIILLIFAISVASSTTAGEEEAGYLELLLSNPVSRARVAIGRALGMIVLLGLLTAVATLTVIGLAPLVKLNHGPSDLHIIESVIAAGLMALTFAAIAFCAGRRNGPAKPCDLRVRVHRSGRIHHRRPWRPSRLSQTNSCNRSLALVLG